MKLIMENWRQFVLKEEKFKTESGALVYLIKNKLLAVLRSGEFLKNKSFEIEIPDKVKQSRNPTKVLNKINKLVLNILDHTSKPIEVLGGKMETGGNLLIKIGLNRDGIKKATRLNEDMIEEIIPALMEQFHELTR